MVQQHIALLESGEHVGRLRRFDLGEMGMSVGEKGGYLSSARSMSAKENRPRRSSGSGQGRLPALISSSLISNSSILGSMSSSTSSRTGGRPTLRRSNSFSRASSRFLGVVLLDLDVFVAGHPERVVSHDLHAAEQLIEVMSDHILQRDIAAFGQRDEAESMVGTLTRANWRMPVSGLRTSTARLIDRPEM